jgi:hypothetical protein
MTSTEDRVRVASRISKELDVRIRQFYATSSSAIPDALETLASIREGSDVKDDATKEDVDDNSTSPQIDAIKGRIDDLLTSIEFMKQEITVKNTQIEKQAYHIQSLIQENSRLNTKLLPESQETKTTQEQKLTRWQYLKGFMFGSK